MGMSVEFRNALFRAAWQAVLLGATGFLLSWSQTDDAKLLAIAFLNPFIGFLVTRAGLEGWQDTALANERGTPQAAARKVEEKKEE